MTARERSAARRRREGRPRREAGEPVEAVGGPAPMSRGRAGREPRPTDGPPPWYPWVKRALDVALAVLQGIVCLPAWILVPLAIKLDDGGAVFYAQERVGRHGQRFRSWKFRSMTPRRGDGPARQAKLEAHRVTRVGRVLRATALDELPQLWNILVGEMSYVGPRALLSEERAAARDGEVVRLEDLVGYEERHRVRPGLTGLAQVRLPRDASHVRKFRLDVEYVRRRSLALDLRLILESVWISLRGAWPDVGVDAGDGDAGRGA